MKGAEVQVVEAMVEAVAEWATVVQGMVAIKHSLCWILSLRCLLVNILRSIV